MKKNSYDFLYKEFSFYNGEQPDKKIIETIKKYCPPTTYIADLGAGDGRNAISLADLGYNVDAFENSDKAIELMEQKALNLPNLKLLTADVMKEILPEEKYNGIILVHLTQHFMSKDMIDMLNNLYKGLKSGGVVIFDALENETMNLKENDYDDKISGRCHFEPNFIENMAKRIGFKIEDISDFILDDTCKSIYYDAFWGFKNPEKPQIIPKPVKLKWFTLLKC